MLKKQYSPRSTLQPPPLPICGLNHVSRVASDVNRSVDFYTAVLGFVEIIRPRFDFQGAWLFAYGVGIHLIKGDVPPRSSIIDPKADHLSFQSAQRVWYKYILLSDGPATIPGCMKVLQYFRAESLQVVEERLQAGGIPFVKQTVTEDGLRVHQVFIHDPDQHMIEICNCDVLPVIPLGSQECAGSGPALPCCQRQLPAQALVLRASVLEPLLAASSQGIPQVMPQQQTVKQIC